MYRTRTAFIVFCIIGALYGQESLADTFYVDGTDSIGNIKTFKVKVKNYDAITRFELLRLRQIIEDRGYQIQPWNLPQTNTFTNCPWATGSFYPCAPYDRKIFRNCRLKETKELVGLSDTGESRLELSA